jgi:uncharacterized protein (DUF1697 family)
VPRIVVLLRGVNVGTGNRVPMAAFRSLLEGLGLSSVRTVLNSGNAVADARRAEPDVHADAIAAALRDSLGVTTPVIVKSADAWRRIVEGNPMVPPEPERSRFFVAFARSPDDLRSLAPLARLAQGLERLTVTDDAAYVRLPSGMSSSELGKALLGRAGRSVTTRNWATVLRLDALVGVG